MNKNLCTYQAQCDITVAFLAHELGRMDVLSPSIGEGESDLYRAIEKVTLARLDPTIVEALETSRAWDKAHTMLLEAGFNAWLLLGEWKKRSR